MEIPEKEWEEVINRLADLEKKVQGQQKIIGSKLNITLNEAREMHGLQPVPGGDEALTPLVQGGERKILYRCNGEKEGCSKSNCYKTGGTCRHTLDINYAESFHLTECKNWMEGEKISHAEEDGTADHKLNDLP